MASIFVPGAGFAVHKQEAREEGEGEGAYRIQSWVQRIQQTLDRDTISLKPGMYLFVMFAIHEFGSILPVQKTSIPRWGF